MPTPTNRTSEDVPPIVDVDWLRARLTSVTVCEVGSTMSGRDPVGAYANGHLPTARYVSLDDVLAAPPDGTNGRHPLPTPDRLRPGRSANSALPITMWSSPTTAAGGGFAGRLVWMLRIIGQPGALLDGGFGAWDGPIETGEPSRRGSRTDLP